LRFIPAEAAEFLNRVLALDLFKADGTAVEDCTEGRIAGLQLAAISMRV
jgi:LuxR family maltose regulon positive regulatory protein